jgi:F-type H+/Na+-transporting ATPase subunit alpha
LAINKILPFEAGLHQFFRNSYKDLMADMDKSGAWNDEIEGKFKAGIAEFKKTGSY